MQRHHTIEFARGNVDHQQSAISMHCCRNPENDERRRNEDRKVRKEMAAREVEDACGGEVGGTLKQRC